MSKELRRPPKLFPSLLRQVIWENDQESLPGDFEETYHAISQDYGMGRARLWYLWHICKLVPAYITYSILWSNMMIKNYFKIALRIIRKHKGYSFINILGLAIGMAACILIFLFVRYELSYDTYHANADQIFRLERVWFGADGSVRSHLCSVAPSFIPMLEEEFPEIEHAVRTVDSGNTRVSVGDKRFIEDRFYFAEKDIFKVLTIPLIKGDSATALKEPRSLVLSESMALKYFGSQDPLGRQIQVNDDNLYHVTGIMQDTPKNSHVHYDFLASYMTLKGIYGSGANDYFHGTRNFSDNVTYTYLRLAAEADPSTVSARIPDFIDRILGTRRDSDGNIIKASQGTMLRLRKNADIHLYSHSNNELEANFDIRYVNLFTLIAIFVLIIACINFMNLSTARATQRAKEVGLRKVVGANRRILTTQFLGESIFFAMLALILALGFVALVLPYFNAFSGRSLGLSYILTPAGFLILVGVFLTTGLIAGIYPAVYLSSYKSARILRGELTRGVKGARIRQALVVFQFAISICLIICVGVVYRQMQYLLNADLGYDRENIIMLPADDSIRNNWEQIRQNLLNNPQILSAALSKRAPTGRLLDAPGFRVEIKGEMLNNPFSMPHNRVSHDFFKTYNMKIIAGRDFSREFPTDINEAFILNETAIQRLGWKNAEDAIGTPIRTIAPNKQGRIIGVVADFNYESLHNEIVPIITYIQPQQANTASIRIKPGRLQESLDYAKAVWARFHPESPFNYDFLDDRINEQYRNEARMMQVFSYFSLFAIFISCLGLLGLAAFTAARRTKEIGVRKVLGASLPHIVVLLSRDFTKWVFMANILAWPVAFLGMKNWLSQFAYAVRPRFMEFLFAGILSLLIALLTVSYQSIKAAVADPIDSLRYE